MQRDSRLKDHTAKILWIIEKARGVQKNIYSFFNNYTKAFECVDHSKLKILKEMGTPDHFTCLQRNLYASQEETELDMQQWTGSKLGKEYVKIESHHPTYLTLMQITLCKVPGWMKHKLDSRLQGEISITSKMQMTPLLWQKVKRN